MCDHKSGETSKSYLSAGNIEHRLRELYPKIEKSEQENHLRASCAERRTWHNHVERRNKR